MDYEAIIYDIEEGVATLTLNRPDRLNAINDVMIGEIVHAATRTQDDSDVNVLVITGAGRGFCSGGDVGGMSRRQERTEQAEGQGLGLAASRESYRKGIHQIPLTLRRLDKPIIASVNGAAVGAGCDLALMADIRIASEKARFGELYVKRGLAPGDGGAWLLPRIVGLEKACELIFTGEIINAQEALRIGLVSRVVPHDQLHDATRQLALKIAKGPTLAIRMSKLAIYQGLQMDLQSSLDNLAYIQTLLHTTEDFREGVRAFLEKREPEFKGR